MAYTCGECGLPVYSVMSGDGFSSCDCPRCADCKDTLSDCDCDEYYGDDEDDAS